MPRGILIDETGNVYGSWTVMYRVQNRNGSKDKWLCRCICGTEHEVIGGNLRFGKSRSCGCLGRKAKSDAVRDTMLGRRFGRLIVIGRGEITKCGATWKCKCDCGNTTTVNGKALKQGATKSCGCLRQERSSLPEYEASFNALVGRLIENAKSRGYEWGLSGEQVGEITKRRCFYCDAEPAQGQTRNNKKKRPNGVYVYNGIDRVDNTQGYTIDNVVACCASCNMGKRTMTISEFRDWATRVYNNFAVRDGVQE